ncbi:pyridoxamine kinase [Sporosarcina sp. BI001-red]|uniref:pyridoxamine kinase n=1 Tax=Sporosarcina sp. BI001-red TaxID=2282866 RepID=UPI000E2787AD|nr:pyridoxamine kinase [Sporosarcina sp. BI001-red]REB05481.1 pyridoxamine kinase [Sporosarcina sp. BI001-red]
MKKVAIIQDMSSFGKCSLTAAIPVLSVMGVQAVPLPTAILTSQTEYPSYFCEDLTAKMTHFTDEWHKMGAAFDGIHTGFVTGKEQIENIFSFLHMFHKEETTLLVDPVMGDRGQMYDVFTSKLIGYMKELVKRADVITPNVTECCLLTGLSYDKLQTYRTNKDYVAAIEEAGWQLQSDTNAKVIITGLNPPALSGTRSVGNMYIDGASSYMRLQEYNGKSYSGTGDLFASVMMGGLMRGQDTLETMELAEKFLTAAIQSTSEERIPTVAGVNFESYLRMLL